MSLPPLPLPPPTPRPPFPASPSTATSADTPLQCSCRARPPFHRSFPARRLTRGALRPAATACSACAAGTYSGAAGEPAGAARRGGIPPAARCHVTTYSPGRARGRDPAAASAHASGPPSLSHSGRGVHVSYRHAESWDRAEFGLCLVRSSYDTCMHACMHACTRTYTCTT